jgi:NAD+ synthase
MQICEPLARQLANHFGVETIVEDVIPALECAFCYARRDGAVKNVYPDYGPEKGY